MARPRDSRSIRFEREQDHLVTLRSRVRVQPGSFTFGSRSGRIPLTLVNDLPQAVVVVLRLEPQTPRLRLDPPLAPQVIGPNRKVQVEVPATAVAGGPVVVEATLHTTERRSPTASRCCCTSTSPRSARWRWSSPSARPSCCSWPPGCGSSAGSGPPAGTDPGGPGDDHGPEDPDDPGQPDPSDEPADVTA